MKLTLLSISFMFALIVPVFRLLTYVTKRRNRLTSIEVAEIIERHLSGAEGMYDWDEFTSLPIADDYLDAIRKRCSEIDLPVPLSAEKTDELHEMIEKLRARASEEDYPHGGNPGGNRGNRGT